MKRTASLVQEISAASEEQNSNLNSFNATIEQFNQVAQQTAASSEELDATASVLNDQSIELKNTISFFRIEGGSDDETITQSRSAAHVLPPKISRQEAQKIVKNKIPPNLHVAHKLPTDKSIKNEGFELQ